MRRLFLLLLLLAPLAAVPARAQEDNDDENRPGTIAQLGVYDAIQLAEQNSPSLNRMRAEIQAKAGERAGALGVASPQLMYFREGMGNGGGRFAEQRWVISQPITQPVTTWYRMRRISTERSALESSYEAERLHLKSAVKKAYTEVLYSQEIVHLRRQEVQLSRELQDAVRTRVEVGEAPGLDQIKAEIQLTDAETNLADAVRQFQTARYSLFNVIGLEPEDQRYSITFPDTLSYAPVVIDQERVMAEMDRQLELTSATQRTEAAALGIRETRSLLLPDLTLDLYPQDYGRGYRSFGFQVGLRLPLWFMLNQRPAMQVARANAQAEQWRRQDVFLNLKKEMELTWHSYETAEQTIRRYHDIVQTRAGEMLHLTQEGYRIGELDLLTLLDTQRTYLASQKRYYDALRDYYDQLIDLERYLRTDLVFTSSPSPELTNHSPAP